MAVLQPPLHPHRQALQATVCRWTTERDSAGRTFVAGRYGYYQPGRQPLPAAVLAELAPAEVPAALAEVRERCGAGPVTVWVEGVERERRLRRHLIASGCVPCFEASYLAHVGRPEQPQWPAQGAPRTASRDELDLLVRLKCQAFMATEREPSAERLRRERERRAQDWAAGGRFLLAEVVGEPAGFISWFEDGPDYFINLLAVRVPFRRQGLASALVQELLCRAYQAGARGVVVVPEPAVARLYAQLGFHDELCRRYAYELRPVSGA